jgi:hypothetical protein
MIDEAPAKVIAARSGATGQPFVGLGRTIDVRIGADVTAGTCSQDKGGSVDLNVTPHIRPEPCVNASGGSSAGAGAQWQFK